MRSSVIVAALAAPLFLQAEELKLTLAPANTQIHWTVGSALHTVHGTFQLKRGNLRLDTLTGAAAGEIVVDAASGESGNGPRDRRMNKEVLEAQKYPEAIFTPDKVLSGPIRLDTGGDFRLHGAFTIHGVAHELVLPVHLTRTGSTVTGTAAFDIPYVEWGMKDPSNFLLKVDRVVKLELETKVPLTPVAEPH